MEELVFSATVIFLILIGYWTFVVFPKQRDYKKHVEYVKTLAEGDQVITYGGLIGEIVSFDDEYGTATVKIAENVEVKMITAALRQQYDPEEIARNIRLAQGMRDDDIHIQ